jgi:hypothetical protein
VGLASFAGLVIVWALLYGVTRKLAASPFQGVTRLPFAWLAEVVAASGFLALAAVAFFWQLLFTADTWMPAGGGDLAPFLYPNYHFAAEYLRQGVIPLWNPHLYSGAPFAADIQSGLFYPLNLILFLLVPELTYEWLEALAIFHFWLAGTNMYICLRLLTPASPTPAEEEQTAGLIGRPLRSLAAFAGALAFQFSDLFIVHFGNLNMIAVAAWLPLVFLLFHRSLLQNRPGLAAASGAVLAFATLAGHIQITLFILLTLALYTLWYSGYSLHTSPLNPKPPGETDHPIRTIDHAPSLTSHASRFTPHVSRLTFYVLYFTLTLLTTIGLSALLLLPAYEMSQYTPRAQLPYEEAARYSLHPVQMVGLLVPGYFGRDPALHWGPWERVETGYIGIMTLILALIGVLLSRGYFKGFLMGLGLLSLLLAMGGYSLFHGWLYAFAPGFDQMRAPARFILLLDFSLAALAAFGLNELLAPLTPAGQARLSALLKGLTWSLGGLLVVALPLSYYAMLVTQDRNPAIFNRAVGAASGVAFFAFFVIASLVALYIVCNYSLHEYIGGSLVILIIGLDLFMLGYNVDTGHTYPVAGFHHPEALAFLQNDPNLYRLEVTTDVWHAWQPNTALLNHLYDVWGLYNPLTLADTTLYWSGAPPRNTGRYNFLGIKYIIASKAGAPADGNIVPVFEADPQINIYLNQDALARVLFVGQAEVVADQAAAWEAIRAADFDPAQTVILEEGEALNTQPNSRLAILQYGINEVTVSVESDQPGYLVLSDAYYPGWQTFVDGQPEPIRRANYAFRAVYVPAGAHEVKFRFEPPIWKVGLAITGLTLLTLILWLIWQGRKG